MANHKYFYFAVAHGCFIRTIHINFVVVVVVAAEPKPIYVTVTIYLKHTSTGSYNEGVNMYAQNREH